MKKSSRHEEFVTINGERVPNPNWVGQWPKEGEEVKVGGSTYKVMPSGSFVRISPPKKKRNG